jgi:hypothetical protein
MIKSRKLNIDLIYLWQIYQSIAIKNKCRLLKTPNDSHTAGKTFKCDWIFDNEDLRLTAIH